MSDEEARLKQHFAVLTAAAVDFAKAETNAPGSPNDLWDEEVTALVQTGAQWMITYLLYRADSQGMTGEMLRILMGGEDA